MLAMFAQNDRYGYELKNMYDTLLVINEALNFGQVYSTLFRLERDGLIVQQTEANALPEKKVYHITATGRAELGRWVANADAFDPYPDSLSYKLAACRLIDRDLLLSSIEAYRVLLLRKMQELTKAQQQLTEEQAGAELVIERNLFRLQADIEWMALCIEKLTQEDEA